MFHPYFHRNRLQQLERESEHLDDTFKSYMRRQHTFKQQSSIDISTIWQSYNSSKEALAQLNFTDANQPVGPPQPKFVDFNNALSSTRNTDFDSEDILRCVEKITRSKSPSFDKGDLFAKSKLGFPQNTSHTTVKFANFNTPSYQEASNRPMNYSNVSAPETQNIAINLNGIQHGHGATAKTTLVEVHQLQTHNQADHFEGKSSQSKTQLSSNDTTNLILAPKLKETPSNGLKNSTMQPEVTTTIPKGEPYKRPARIEEEKFKESMLEDESYKEIILKAGSKESGHLSSIGKEMPSVSRTILPSNTDISTSKAKINDVSSENPVKVDQNLSTATDKMSSVEPPAKQHKENERVVASTEGTGIRIETSKANGNENIESFIRDNGNGTTSNVNVNGSQRNDGHGKRVDDRRNSLTNQGNSTVEQKVPLADVNGLQSFPTTSNVNGKQPTKLSLFTSKLLSDSDEMDSDQISIGAARALKSPDDYWI